MVFPVDLTLFEGTAHSPSFLNLRRSMGRPDLTLRDYCIPVNPYFPTPAMFDELRRGLEESLKYYPSSNEDLTRLLCGAIGLDPGGLSIKKATREIEQDLIRRALGVTQGNRTNAAKLLEISHRALLYKMKDYGIT